MKKALLTVAGFDPSSGAGLTLDLKVFRLLGFYGLAIPTSLTVQNSYRVYRQIPLSADLVLDFYRKLKIDFKIYGIKFGMMGSFRILPAVKKIIDENKKIPLVVDPVLQSSSGCWLFEEKHLKKFIKTIKGRISLLTPNLPESSLLTGEKISNIEQMKKAARKIFDLVEAPCLIKGGHLSGENHTTDILFDGQQFISIRKKKLPEDVHGSGCFLSSAILCYLVQGQDLITACQKASRLTGRKLRNPVKISKRALFQV